MWEDFLLYVAVGLVAQMVDGAVGMAYGVTASSVLMSFGIPPSTTSACVHAAETFTTGASGAAHWRLGNVDKKLVAAPCHSRHDRRRAGAYVLSNIDGNADQALHRRLSAHHGPLHRLSGPAQNRRRTRAAQACGARSASWAASSTAIGGGGWGPIVTTTLIGQGTAPRYAIGSVNLAEFFVTLTMSLTFLFTIGLELWPIITGLVVGGVIAAPFAALATKHCPTSR